MLEIHIEDGLGVSENPENTLAQPSYRHFRPEEIQAYARACKPGVSLPDILSAISHEALSCRELYFQKGKDALCLSFVRLVFWLQLLNTKALVEGGLTEEMVHRQIADFWNNKRDF